jgi:hypothetical protein
MRALRLLLGPSARSAPKAYFHLPRVLGVANDDEWAPFERSDEIASAEVDKVKAKSKKKSKQDTVWPAQAVKIESVVNCVAMHKGTKSTSRPSSRPST